MTDTRLTGLIGLGFMGAAIGERLRSAGFALLGFDIDDARMRHFAASGGETATSVTEVARRCARSVLAVYDTGQVESVLEQMATVDGKQIVLCTSTVDPQGIVALAARAAEHGISLIEVPVSGTSVQVRAGEGVGLVAGDGVAIEVAADLLDAICPKRFCIGATGDAAKAKLAINLVLQLNRAALAEGLVFAERLGLPASAFLDVLRRSPAYSSVMDTKGKKMLSGNFSPDSRIAQTLKDARLMLNQAAQAAQRLPLTAVNAALLQVAVDLHGPDVDPAAVIAAIRAQVEA
jgi:3-hydroxyisobutyrate dehydrogenase-like beta-hydroxyacid dehydrogenase